ncbi:MAG: hypothetical protein LUD07_06705 [Clostridiales bacterium]|nr:hypothetical protein [Clostridiales bacterium]
MKRYFFCIFLLFAVSIVCVVSGVSLTRLRQMEEPAPGGRESSALGSAEIRPSGGYPAVNQEEVLHEMAEARESDNIAKPGEYYLVCENGFLMVFQKDRETICLYTHIPVTDFPETEQEKLRIGIGFSSMLEVLHYLESYTS